MDWTHNQGTPNYSRAGLPVLIAHGFPCVRHRQRENVLPS